MARRGRRSGPALPAPAGALLALAALLPCAGLGCATRGEPSDCLDQRQEARNRALSGDLEQAQALLDRVRAHCGPNSESDVRHISKLIAEKTAALRERERREANKSAELREFPSRSFVEWATDRAGDITNKTPSVTCAERSSPLFGFCEGERADAPNMHVRYWQAQPSAYLYSLVTEAAPSCQDLGEFRAVRSWSRDGSQLELCELTNRRLRHLSALIVHTAARHEMYIYSQEYLSLDSSFERRLSVVSEH